MLYCIELLKTLHLIFELRENIILFELCMSAKYEKYVNYICTNIYLIYLLHSHIGIVATCFTKYKYKNR